MSEVMYEVRTVRTDQVVFTGTHQECSMYLKEAIGLVLDPHDFVVLRAKGGEADDLVG